MPYNTYLSSDMKLVSKGHCLLSTYICPEVIRLIDSKQIEVEQLITKKIKLDDIVKDGFEALAYNPSEIKNLN